MIHKTLHRKENIK